MDAKWDVRFMLLAVAVSSWSKHPNWQVGCLLVDDDKNQLSSGFNGLPRRVADDWRLTESAIRRELVVHAEANAVAAAARNGHALKGATAYITLRPCCQCAALLIQAGVKRVVAFNTEHARLAQNMRMAERSLEEAGVEYVLLEQTEVGR
jgi:dCMP deaminase